MHNKITVRRIVTLTIIIFTNAYANHYNNDQQQTEPVVIDDTATIDSEMQPKEAENKAGVTFTRKIDNTSEEKAALNKKEKKQTIRGLFTLGGFNKDEKDKNKTRISSKN